LNIGSRIVTILIYLYVIFQPLLPGKYKINGIPFNGDAILALAILIYVVSAILFVDSRRRFISGVKNFFMSSIGIFMFLLIFIMLVSTSYAESRTIALSEAARFVSYIGLFFIIKYEFSSQKIIDNILRLYITSVFIVGIIGIIEGIFGIGFVQQSEHGIRDRVFSTMENSNNLGAFMVIAIFPIIMLLLKERNKIKKNVYLFLMLIALTNIIICYSRNAWIGLAIGCVILGLIYSWKIILALVVLGGGSLFIPAISNRLAEFTDASQNMSRIKLWDIAWFMIKDHPIRGVGNGNYRVMYDKYKLLLKQKIEYYPSNNFHPHNILLKVQSELGVFGTGAFLGMVISIFCRILKFTREIDDEFYTPFFKGFLASFIAFMGMNLIDNFFSAPKVIAFFWLLIACFESVMYRKQREGDLYY
jgi:putative inorganic carbon (hco3(-)) transporter